MRRLYPGDIFRDGLELLPHTPYTSRRGGKTRVPTGRSSLVTEDARWVRCLPSLTQLHHKLRLYTLIVGSVTRRHPPLAVSPAVRRRKDTPFMRSQGKRVAWNGERVCEENERPLPFYTHPVEIITEAKLIARSSTHPSSSLTYSLESRLLKGGRPHGFQLVSGHLQGIFASCDRLDRHAVVSERPPSPTTFHTYTTVPSIFAYLLARYHPFSPCLCALQEVQLTVGSQRMKIRSRSALLLCR